MAKVKVVQTGTDHESGDTVEQGMSRKNGFTGAISFTHPLIKGNTGGRFCVNPDFGINMNQNGSFSGSGELVHDGTDSPSWAGSQISGTKVTFDSSDRSNTGVTSVLVDNPAINDTWQFYKGSTIDLTSSTAITFAVNVDKDWSDDDSVTIVGYDTVADIEVGTPVNIEDYVDALDFDTWNNAVVPLSDMGLQLETIDSFRMTMQTTGGPKRPKFYMDDIQIRDTDDPIVFAAAATLGTKFHISEVVFTIADTGTGGAAYSYLKIGALTKLINGVVLNVKVEGESVFIANIKCIGDLMQSGVVVINHVDDGTNTFISMAINLRTTEPIILHSAFGDTLSMTISDDLTGLDLFRVFVRGWVEIL